MTDVVGSRRIGENASEYAAAHFVEGVAEEYDAVYAPASYDSAMWTLQRPFVRRSLSRVRSRSGRLKYFDFACGTGRIIAAVEDVATEALGIDISPLMLAHAERRVARSSLRCGNILQDATLADDDYDAITAFRFFLNTEPEIRLPVMRDLARRLRGPESRLIFNVHANGRSILALTDGYRRLRGWPPVRTLSHSHVSRMITNAGLEIETLRGYGLLPRRLYRTAFAPLAAAIDRQASRSSSVAPLSQDIVYVCRPRREGHPASDK